MIHGKKNEDENPDFPKGLIVKRHENSPDFVLAQLSFNVDEFCKWAQENKKADGWLNVKALMSQAGKPYGIIDRWEPNQNNNSSSGSGGGFKPKTQTPAFGQNQTPKFGQAPPVDNSLRDYNVDDLDESCPF